MRWTEHLFVFTTMISEIILSFESEALNGARTVPQDQRVACEDILMLVFREGCLNAKACPARTCCVYEPPAASQAPCRKIRPTDEQPSLHPLNGIVVILRSEYPPPRLLCRSVDSSWMLLCRDFAQPQQCRRNLAGAGVGR